MVRGKKGSRRDAQRAIVENIKWFINIPPLKKIAIQERELKRVKRLRGLALKCLSSKK